MIKDYAFSQGDRVVLPPYGIGVVCGISIRQIAGAALPYYQVEFPNTSSRAFVPVGGPGASSMRPALTGADMPKLLGQLQDGHMNLPRQWAARHRRVTEILAGGDPFELASLACELRRWQALRGLPDLDRQAYRRVLKLLLQEVGTVEAGQASDVLALLDDTGEAGLN